MSLTYQQRGFMHSFSESFIAWQLNPCLGMCSKQFKKILWGVTVSNMGGKRKGRQCGWLWETPVRRGRGGGVGTRLFAFGGAYWPFATAHSDPLWVRTCFGCVIGAPG